MLWFGEVDDCSTMWTVTEDELYLYITVQDEVEIFFDNKPQDINKQDVSKDYRSVKVVKIPRNTKVLGVKATNRGTNPGLIASITGDKLVSDNTWKFTTSVDSENWASPSYDDTKWKNARIKAVHGGAPWNITFNQISRKANWIWAETDTYRVVYFRVYLGK